MRAMASAAISRLSAIVNQHPLPQEVRARRDPSCARRPAACPLTQKASVSTPQAASAASSARPRVGGNRLRIANATSGNSSHSAGPCSRDNKERLLPDNRRLGA
ncbi:Uncharacterised protein [Serratia marcescens]|nr:Uncharacterised protein [Serratia marcescens]